MPLKISDAFKSVRRRLLIAALLVGTAVGVYALDLALTNNFHTVAEGRLYRSGQMSSNSLAHAIQAHGIKTVINLRGNVADAWYPAETNLAHQVGVKHVDFCLSAVREFTDAEMDQIVATVATAPKPILIHCRSGSDRSGLVGALYLYSFEGQPAKTASGQLSALYGHLPWFGSGTDAMDRSFWRYVSNHIQHPATDRSTVPATPESRTNAALIVRSPAEIGAGH